MKIRSGFVSNSSSSSFVCDVCGTSESGMDASASDFDMACCENGHTFCNCHAENMPDPDFVQLRAELTQRIMNRSYGTDESKKIEVAELEKAKDEDILGEYHDYEVPSCKCPVCSFNIVTDSDGYSFLKKKFSLTNEDVLGYIKTGFKTYREFKSYLYPPKK